MIGRAGNAPRTEPRARVPLPGVLEEAYRLEYDLIAPCYFGVERAAAFDFQRIGARDVAVTDGRVAFRGTADVIAAANLWSRCAERVRILL